MILATWNVNSIRSRHDRVLAWLERYSPDVLCLQELKVTDEVFDPEPIRSAGYHVAMLGQKTYNGVAILSREPATDITRNMDDGTDDLQARLIAATFGDTRIINIYVPNGSEVGCDKWTYKLAWLARLADWLDAHHTPDQPLILCGDFNIAPTDADLADPDGWRDSVVAHAEARAALQRLLDWGLTDVFAAEHPDGGLYSWWDYRHQSFAKNRGMRLDLVLATDPMVARCRRTLIDRDERAGEKPSDHVPVVAIFD